MLLCPVPKSVCLCVCVYYTQLANIHTEITRGVMAAICYNGMMMMMCLLNGSPYSPFFSVWSWRVKLNVTWLDDRVQRGAHNIYTSCVLPRARVRAVFRDPGTFTRACVWIIMLLFFF